MAFLFIIGPPLMVLLWWWEKGKFTLQDAIGFGAVILLFWPIGFWIVRRKNVSPW